MNNKPGACSKLLASAVLAGFVWLDGAAQPAQASDYSYECQSVSRDYMMRDEDLFKAVRDGQDLGPPIPFQIERRVTLAKRKGYCISNNKAAKGRKYGFSSEVFALKIRFKDAGEERQFYVLCEQASDGLPAMFECDKEVITLNSEGPAKN